MADTHYRSLLKAISWRIISVIFTTLISWIITGSFKIAISIGIIDVAVKIFLFYFHERIWQRIKLGKMKRKPYPPP
ncbi:MAG: DUF2061 domain-containing protein [Gammaproteobacteria bacterium]|nr:MAG: DUF2061 domain-containing protein [Gammaproteobacteria bacterium]UTW41976.1 DUF2061 domain-containing protein [bacterium SCSIO 12844]